MTREFLKKNTPAILTALVILVLCVMPVGENGTGGVLSRVLAYDKVGHAGMFAVLGFYLQSGFQRQVSYPAIREYAPFLAVAVGIAYGVLTEGMQFLIITSRHVDILDLGADMTGVFLGYAFFQVYYWHGIDRS